MSSRLTGGIVLWLSLLTATSVLAQPGAAETPRERVSREFEAGPAVGEPAPDVEAYDAEGTPFPLSSLKGSHTVLVFGCLT
jgi:cytochrome oxidase Cu insertion factor (SCO1/SenC/PrrC family)